MTMTFYCKKEQLYLERDVWSVGLVVSILQEKDFMQFTGSKALDKAVLSSIAFVENHYTREALDIIYGLTNSTTAALPMRAVS